MSQTAIHSLAGNTGKQGEPRYNTVMLIDDNSLDLFIHKKLLESQHFAGEISSFESADAALVYLKENPAYCPDLVFLDIMMPGTDGFGFLDRIENDFPHLFNQMKVVMLSSSDSFKDLNRANKNKMVRKFLNKPLTKNTVDAIRV